MISIQYILISILLSQVNQIILSETPSFESNRTGSLTLYKHKLIDELSWIDDDRECLGNRAEALRIGRKCSRRCKRDVPCENLRKQCLCDGLCGFSCVKPDLVCEDLPKIENGRINSTSTTFGTKVAYQCNPGFYLYGSPIRTCQGDREWSGITPECNSEPKCRNPPQVNDAVSPDERAYKVYDKVQYTCHSGYQSIGSGEAECMLIEQNRTGWVWRDESFECIPLSCSDPIQPIKNGRLIMLSIEHGSKGYIRCLDGFKLQGDSTTVCLKGNWTITNSSCIEIYCGFPGYIQNGRILLIGLTGMYEYKPYIRRISNNRQVAYECDSDYRMSDGAPSGATCINGQWRPEGLPACVKQIEE